jgi:proteasome lid subunit RPN8/RPN11
VSPAPAKLLLPWTLHARLITHAEATPVVEICGLLIGSGELDVVVDDIVFASNMAYQPDRRFEIDPQLQFDWLRQLRGSARRLVGHFHSHPTGPAIPSDNDLAMAHDPYIIWVIVGLSPKVEVRAYIRPDPSLGFSPLDLVLT